MSHTPGPWAISPETDGMELVAYDTNPWRIRQLIMRPERGLNWIENARLMAASPDLLAALEAALGPLQLYNAYGWPDREKVIGQARAAIAKARGV